MREKEKITDSCDTCESSFQAGQEAFISVSQETGKNAKSHLRTYNFNKAKKLSSVVPCSSTDVSWLLK